MDHLLVDTAPGTDARRFGRQAKEVFIVTLLPFTCAAVAVGVEGDVNGILARHAALWLRD